MRPKITELIGWYGICAIIGAYALVSFGVITSSNIWYQLLNLTGAIGIVVNSFYKKDYQPVVLNLLWITIAIVAITKILFLAK